MYAWMKECVLCSDEQSTFVCEGLGANLDAV